MLAIHLGGWRPRWVRMWRVTTTTSKFAWQYCTFTLLMWTAFFVLHCVVWHYVNSVWHTSGEVAWGGMVVVATCVSALSAILWLSREFRPISLGILLLFGYVVLASQAPLIARLAALQSEVLHIAAYAEDHKSAFGEYPKDLAGYNFSKDEFRSLIWYYAETSEESDETGPALVLSYKMNAHDNTCREYSSTSGWYYYPD